MTKVAGQAADVAQLAGLVPARMRAAAMEAASKEEAQSRFTVIPGTANPAPSAAIRPML